jgi:hypothetical protein
VAFKKYPTSQLVHVEVVLEHVTHGELHGEQTFMFAFVVDGEHWIHYVP